VRVLARSKLGFKQPIFQIMLIRNPGFTG